MNKFLLLTAFSLFFICEVNAQDIIVLKDGSVLETEVVEISSTEVRYKKYTNLTGPVYVIDKSSVYAINYKNGEKDIFSSAKDDNSEEKAQVYSETNMPKDGSLLVSPDNEELLLRYNRLFDPGYIDSKDSPAIAYITKFALTNVSVISNEHLEVYFKMPYLYLYEIWIRNKTNSPIIIDLMYTSRSDSDGVSRTYYDASEVHSSASGQAVGGGVSLGPISVGGGNTNSLTTVYNNERYVVIPPKGNASIGVWKDVVKKKALLQQDYRKWVSHGEKFTHTYYANEWEINKKGILNEYLTNGYGNNYDEIKDDNMPVNINSQIMIGESVVFDVDNSPLVKEYRLLYYTDQGMSNAFVLPFALYIRQIIGIQLNTNNFHKNCTKMGYDPQYDLIADYYYKIK